MGTFGNSGRPVFKPSVYQPGRHNRRLPRGLGLLCIGIVLGAGGVLFLQTNYGPPRLSTEQSEQVRSELNAATLERQRLQGQIDDLQRQIAASHAAQANTPAEAATQPAPAVTPPAAVVEQPAAPEPAPAPAAAAAPAAEPAPAPTAHARAPSESEASGAVQAPSETQQPAVAPEPPKPVAHRPVHHDYEEPHSELRMTIIPMPQSQPQQSK